MDPTQRDHHATITTPRGSVVVVPFLTGEQADAIAAAYGADDPPPRPTATEDEPPKTTCGRCGGAGGWYETVKTTTPGGSEVVTQKWVNCRPCGGAGSLPK